MIDLDAELPAIARGDAVAFGRWMRGAEEPLRRSLRSFAATVDTEAVLQETLLRVWQVAPRVEVDRPNALLRLALRVARNAAIDEARRARVAPVDDLERAASEALAAIDPIEPDPHLRALIEECRAKLPPAPRQAFDARLEARGGAADRDLARKLRMQLNTFLKNVGRARALLLECLARSGVVVEVG
ncbi:MAG: hypothetical protein H6735_30795 [Alphaproteobacteria bacterium]|nr:hypothetical protein [Alphaproteobacteria bacterium]